MKPTRTSFGVTFAGLREPRIEASLLREVEANFAEDPDPEELTRPYGHFAWRFTLIASGVFLAAIGLGFLGILLWAAF